MMTVSQMLAATAQCELFPSAPTTKIREPEPFSFRVEPGLPLLLVSCSDRKKAPADGLDRDRFVNIYDGPIWQQIRKSGYPITNIAAISAKYGLLQPGRSIAPYDFRMDAKRVEEISRFDDHRIAHIIRAAGSAIVVGGSLYREIVHRTIRRYPDLAELVTFIDGSYLKQRAAIGRFLANHRIDDE